MNEKAKCKNCTDEMIEEMAKTLYKNRPYSELWWEDALEIAEILVKKGYRKIPKGSVVLSKEEYEGKEIVVEMSGRHKLRLTVGKFGEMSRVLEESTRTETAKEILQEVKSLLFPEEGGLLAWLVAIADKYGVEVEE